MVISASMQNSRRCRSLLLPAGAVVLLLSGQGAAVAQSPASGDPPDSRNESREESEILIERMKWFQSGRTGADGLVPADGRTRAIAEMRANVAKGLLRDSASLVGGSFWTPIGPSPIYDGSIAYAGRVTSFAAHPTDPNVLYLGSAQGGVWKTTNSGLTWQPVTDFQDSLSIGSIALAPSNPNIVYVGTGEANWSCDSYFGTGVLRSADGGVTWILRGSSTFSGTSIARIVVHPTNPDILWAVSTAGTGGYPCSGGNATGTGVWKSTDGGINWTQQLVGDWGFGGHDLVISPSDPNRLYAGMYLSGVWRTTDGGSNWVKLGGGLPASDVARVDLAIDPNNSNTVYALIAAGGPLLGIYRSLDSGNSWLPLSIPSGSCQYWAIDDLCSYAGTGYGSCWYNLVIEVAPDGGVWVGGLGVFRSADGGLTWSNACPSDMHVDQHAIAFASDGKTWVGNDGGAFVTSDDGGNWLNRNSGLSLAQFYPGAALHPSKASFALGGTQDNGSLAYRGTSSWKLNVPGGDGAFHAIDSSSPDTTWYISHQGLIMYKTTDGGANYTFASGTVDRAGASFIAPFAMCPGNPLVLIAGTFAVWKTSNGADSWALNSPSPISDGSSIHALSFAPSVTSCATYFAGVSSSLYRTTTAGASWSDITPGGLCYISDIAVDAANPNVVYVACGGFWTRHLYRSANALAVAPTWTAVDSGLPDTPFNAVLIDPDNSSVVYIGTDIGVFKSTNNGSTWSYFMNGHPKTAVFDLVADSSTQTLVSFTHGRGAYRLASSNPTEVNPAETMTAGKGAGTTVLVTYAPACGATDHVVYWGLTPLVGSPIWTNASCGRGTTGTASFDPGTPAPGKAFYFVIVGQNATKEGSYGRNSASVERSEAVGVGACDRPLDLTGACTPP